MNTEKFFLFDEHLHSIIKAANGMDATLLITGSTGTGKSHLARWIFENCPNRRNRWCAINLATLSENLIESELFGHEKGAFTGADTKRLGKLELSNGGTVFLDEIGELPLRLQTKLLDFIQYRKITPVGSNREISIDVKIIAATNKNLEIAVKAGTFRADLFHRLNVFHVMLPDLGLNPKSLQPLVDRFLGVSAEKAQKPTKKISRQVQHVFRMYRWPGNIRELENAIEFAVGVSETPEITTRDLPGQLQVFAKECERDDGAGKETLEEAEWMRNSTSLHVEAPDQPIALIEVPISLDFHETKASFEKSYLSHVLKLCNGHINLTSRRIGLNKVSLAEKVKRYGIDWRKLKQESVQQVVSAH